MIEPLDNKADIIRLMNQTITRKYLAAKLPDLSSLSPRHDERYYLYLGPKSVIRVQSKNDQYELEKKTDVDNQIREESMIELSKDEFDVLTKLAKHHATRDSFKVSDEPNIVLRIYKDRYQGLNRCEVSFKTTQDAQAFVPPSWFGEEITDSPLAKELTLLSLTEQQFSDLLVQYTKV